MSSSATTPTREEIERACAALAAYIANTKYAIVGGAALQLLGSPRLTDDVDVVVPAGQVAAARRFLASAETDFTVDPRTRHTYYKSSLAIEIQFISPPALFQEVFNADTPTHSLIVGDQTVEILKPALILNAKCRSVLGRPNDQEKANDAKDIKYLLSWLASNNALPSASEVPNANKEFVEWFIETYDEAEYWTGAGYKLDQGSF